MPKSTFYNLPKEKQDKVLEAAKKEFFRAEDGEILIKNIVVDAKIPRGSFYQYFESKDDLVEFLIKNHLKNTEERFCLLIDKNDGDILAAFEEMFNKIIDKQKMEGVNKERKVMEHIKKLQEKYGCQSAVKDFPKEMTNTVLLNHIDKSKYRITTSEELASVYHIIMSMMIKNAIDFKNGDSKEETKKAFKRDLDYLRYGVMK